MPMRGLFLVSMICLPMVAMQPQSEQESKKSLLHSQLDKVPFTLKLEELKQSLLNPKTPAKDIYMSTTALHSLRANIRGEYHEYFIQYELVELRELAKAQCKLTKDILKAFYAAGSLPDEPDEEQIADLAKAQTKLKLIENFCKKMK